MPFNKSNKNETLSLVAREVVLFLSRSMEQVHKL